MPNLVNSGASGNSSLPFVIRSWEPDVEQIVIGDRFYGFKFYQSNGKLIIQEIDDGTVPIQLPSYRVGDSRISNASPTYSGAESLASVEALQSYPDSVDVYSEEVYKTWFTTYAKTSFSWYTDGGGSNAGHFIMEVE